jgi:predicted ribosomally synthesized peptide with SipW-like signal peptide
MSGNGNDRKRFGVRRLLIAAGYLASLAAVVALVTGVAYGFFSATSSKQSNSFTAGTVTQNNVLTGGCTVTNLLPDGLQQSCGTLKVTYAGNVPGYLALDVLIETQAAPGGTKLFNGANDLQVTISSSSPTVSAYSVPVAANSVACPTGAPSGSSCYALYDEIVKTTAFTNSDPQVMFTTKVTLPTSSPTTDQGGAAQIILTAHAVQSGNNGTVSGCIAGSPCNTVTWS